ncbi:MAG: hypothetical protein A2017_20760 [Lentisphaerae bacterium GWF2_44_16]|nr:MAG: hypothetical protein A2017_20760 [Lentisphaerae bacterium GWF2_44_16]
MQMIEMMKRKMFGRSSEQADPDQGTFEGLLSDWDKLNGESAVPPTETEKIEYERRRKTQNNNLNGRVKIPEHLERVDKFIDIPDSEKICPVTGEALVCIGEDITEQLACEPGRLYVIRYRRPKYVSPDRRKGNIVGVLTALLPESPIERCKADVSLITQIIINKYCDHIPLTRQEGIFAREQIGIPVSTMADWCRESANVLKPLHQLLKDTVLSCDYINADDTRELFLQKNGEGAKKGRMWIYVANMMKLPDNKDGPIENIKLMFFDFSQDWNEEHPLKILKNYKGFFQSDAYPGFKNAAKLKDITAIGCWCHSRRKFLDALKAGVKDAKIFVTLINILYRIEHHIGELKKKNVQDDVLLALRKKRALRVFKKFFKKVNSTPALPKSLLGKALTYARNQEESLKRYVENLRFKPDNNVAENFIRPLCVGRNNYLFMGSEGGGRTAAILYSFIGSCRALGINPYEYLKDVLSRINSLPHSRLHELLPHNWQKLRQQK